MRRLAGTLFTFSLIAAACSGSGDDGATNDSSSASSAASSSSSTTSTTVAPAETTTTTTPATTSPTTVAPTTTTTEAPDTEAPAAPAGVVCATGGGSGELTLTWDAPDEADGVTTVRVYMRQPGGSFSRIAKLDVPSADVTTSASQWSTVLYPVDYQTALEAAVTHGDEAGNESGWNPIEVWLSIAGVFGDCPSGPPPAPVITRAERSAGSGEVLLTLDLPASDIASWSVEVDQGSGFAPVSVLVVHDDFPAAGQVGLDIYMVDWTLPATYRVVATDHHANSSAAGERDCPTPISPGDVVC